MLSLKTLNMFKSSSNIIKKYKTFIIIRPINSTSVFLSQNSDSSDSDDEKKKKRRQKSKYTLNENLSKNIRETRKQQKLMSKNKTFDDNLIEATKEVAKALGGNVKQTKTELLDKVKSHSPEMSFSEIILGMKIGNQTITSHTKQSKTTNNTTLKISNEIMNQDKDLSFSHQLFGSEKNRKFYNKNNKISSIKVKYLFEHKPLNIFSPSFNETGPKLDLLEKLHKKELELAITHSPSNIYEEMILWTKQGILWHFPINNEQGLEEEAKVEFYEHVFMEKHLEPWCPKKGPIRHFMELVCVGLSKNPYITVQAKIDHINWFKDFFSDKRNILLEIGAIQQNDLTV